MKKEETTKEKKVCFKDLSTPLKIFVVLGWIAILSSGY
jgi:hypothetical protein